MSNTPTTHHIHHPSPHRPHQPTFRALVSTQDQDRARRHGREVPFLESQLEVLNRHLLDTNRQLRVKLDEVQALQRRCAELERVNGNLVAANRRVVARNGELVQENDMLRALYRRGRR
ncbi:hypothetical protein E4T48_05533 [Aureobasidium sp. EXF-10727]|nr:hypothetical protein E4T48_05533 [Aureobasidium sp. EXF-10727]